jgi:tRNA (guanine-N7-)-methyltransferase
LFYQFPVPRRPVKTIDPNADLSAAFKMADDLPKPCHSETLFGRAAPLELEIGSGKGMFICKVAGQIPQHNFIGIEISIKYARFAAAKLIRQNRSNAIMVCGDAAQVLQDVIPMETLAAVHVYFPDPWWKRAHRKRRILRSEVLQLIESRLLPGGALHFWTDVEEYFTSTLTLLAQTTALQGPFEVPEPEANDDDDYRTHFERRTRLHGEKVYRAVFRKVET